MDSLHAMGYCLLCLALLCAACALAPDGLETVSEAALKETVASADVIVVGCPFDVSTSLAADHSCVRMRATISVDRWVVTTNSLRPNPCLDTPGISVGHQATEVDGPCPLTEDRRCLLFLCRTLDSDCLALVAGPHSVMPVVGDVVEPLDMPLDEAIELIQELSTQQYMPSTPAYEASVCDR